MNNPSPLPGRRSGFTRRAGRGGLAVVGLAVAAGVSVADEPIPPLPPLPAQAAADAEVRPAAFEPGPASRIDRPLPLTGQDAESSDDQAGASAIPQAGNWTLLSAIAAAFVVLAAFRLRPLRAARSLPADVFEVLGEGSFGGQHAVRVVRFGPRTLLVAVSSAGSQTLAELTDPEATQRIVAACTAGRPARPAAANKARPAPRPVSPARPEAAGGEAA